MRDQAPSQLVLAWCRAALSTLWGRSLGPHSPPARSLSLTASCPCLCFPSHRSSGHCCLASGPFRKVQYICPQVSPLLCHPPAIPKSRGLGLPHLDTGPRLPAGTLVPIHVVVFSISLHVRYRCHQILQEVKLLLQLNALLPGRHGKGMALRWGPAIWALSKGQYGLCGCQGNGTWKISTPTLPVGQNILTLLLLKSTNLPAACQFLIRAQPPPGV